MKLQHRDMLNDLVALNDVGLGDWEIDFIGKLNNFWDLSEKQAAALKRSWFRHMTEDKIAERMEAWADKNKPKVEEETQAAAPLYRDGWKGRKF